MRFAFLWSGKGGTGGLGMLLCFSLPRVYLLGLRRGMWGRVGDSGDRDGCRRRGGFLSGGLPGMLREGERGSAGYVCKECPVFFLGVGEFLVWLGGHAGLEGLLRLPVRVRPRVSYG